MAEALPLPASHWCLFLDVDGTLIELTDTPFETRASEPLKTLLREVSGRLGGALAVVSGRSIEYLDALFAPLRLPCAGLHGVERRSASGLRSGSSSTVSSLDPVRGALINLVRTHAGTLLEDKGRTIAVHFRLAPQFAAVVREKVPEIIASLGSDYHAQFGNMMVEIKPRGFDKGGAVREFMQEPPFLGRTPVYVGDDLTDLDGFEAVVAHAGISIAVGDRVHGQYHLADPTAVRAWLRTVAGLRDSSPE